jgi:hypothetical protein
VSSRLGGSLGRLLHTTNGGRLSRGAAGTAAATRASGLTTAADEVIKRLIKVGRHDDGGDRIAKLAICKFRKVGMCE